MSSKLKNFAIIPIIVMVAIGLGYYITICNDNYKAKLESRLVSKETWTIGKVIVANDLTYVLTACGTMSSSAYFDAYVGESVAPSSFLIYHHNEFEIGEERYILLSSKVGYIIVGKLRVIE